MIEKCAGLLLFLLLGTTSLTAQKDSTKRYKVNAFPVFYYSPETKFAAGVAGVFTFHWKKDQLKGRISNLTLASVYTQNKQFTAYIPYNLFFKNDHYRLIGEVGYFRYTYYYFGIGNEVNQSDKERFVVTYPRLRINALKKVANHLFAGIRYTFDQYGQFVFSEDGKLKNRDVVGASGGRDSGLGVDVMYDSRDGQFYPRQGILGEIQLTQDDQWTGSQFKFTKLVIDYSMFHSLAKRTVLAGNLNVLASTGEVPFYLMGGLGGTKRMRGIFEGKYRDKCASQLQVELRQEIFNRWGVVAFAGSGIVSPDYKSIAAKNIKFAGGVGARYQLNKKEHINMRFDLGIGEGKMLAYFTISEAF